jgi:hypothetical protein
MFALISPLFTAGPAMPETVLLFAEDFDDDNWAERGWYDGLPLETTATQRMGTSGRSCVWDWEKTGAINPRGGGARLTLPPVDNVTLEFYIKHSADWAWTGVPWHPHMFHFITNADPAYVGPAYTHLTFYVEAVGGVPRLSIQDGANIDTARIDEDLSLSSETRSVAGCNSDTNAGAVLDCYRAGDKQNNGALWKADGVYFSDEEGPHYKGDWHQVKAQFRLNSVKDGIGQHDGILRYWLDGELLIERHNALFRTGQHPNMQINQFFMGPYFGPGVPQPQRIWIDDLSIYTEIGETSTSVQDSSWGQIKGAN